MGQDLNVSSALEACTCHTGTICLLVLTTKTDPPPFWKQTLLMAMIFF